MLYFGRVENLSGETGHYIYAGSPGSSYEPGEDRALSSPYEEYRQTSELFLSLETEAETLTVRRLLKPPIPRIL